MHSGGTKPESSYHSQCYTESYTITHISEGSREKVLPREQRVQADAVTRHDQLAKVPLENMLMK